MLCFAEIGLLAVTWKVWTGHSERSVVPLLSVAVAVPKVVDVAIGCSLAVLLIAVVCLLRIDRRRQKVSVTTVRLVCIAWVLAAALPLLNMQILQPWHWLFLLLIAQWLTSRHQSILLWRQTLAGIYVFAAVSRIGPQIDSGMSVRILAMLSDLLHLPALQRDPSVVFAGCVAMSVLEGCVGGGLLFAKTRQPAVVAGGVLHASLLVLLGPFGLQQQPGVLIWNLFLPMALLIVFWPNLDPAPAPNSRRLNVRRRWLVLIWAIPLSGLFGFADNWISWQVYSPRPETIRVLIHESAVSQVPDDLQPYLQRPRFPNEWHWLRLDQYVLQSTGAPAYPEDRYQLAQATTVAKELPPEAVRFVVDRPQRWRWWKRERFETNSLAELHEALGPFWLNIEHVR